MATSLKYFREEFYNCTWVFDLFAVGYDFLDGRFFPNADPGLEAAWEFEQKEIKRLEIIRKIVSADGGIPDEVRRYVNLPGGDGELESAEFCMRLFSVLLAIDQAAADMNYLGACCNLTRGRWARTIAYFERNSKQLQQQTSGNVIFKPRYFREGQSQAWLKRALEDTARWRPILERGEDLAAKFQNLIRLSCSGDCEFDFRILSPAQDFHDLNWEQLRLGFVPLIEKLNVRASDAQLAPGPLVLKKETTEPPTFGIQMEGPVGEDCSVLCNRAEAALRYLAKQGCQVVLFPEMVMPDRVVAHLQEVLADLALGNRPRPGLVLGGTFTRLIQRYSPNQPFNVAVVLNHRGEQLWRQRKMQPYDMKRHEQRHFGLETILDSDSCREHIAFSNRKLRVVDSPSSGLRMVVLICEDATRDPGLLAVKELQPGLVMAPVMAGPLEASGGFGAGINQVQQAATGLFAVSNSGALARAAWGSKPGQPPLALVGLPVLNVGSGFRPLDVVSDLETVPGLDDMQVLIYQFPR